MNDFSFWPAVACRLFANPAANAIQKALTGRGLSPSAVIAATHLLLSVVCLPFVFVTTTPASLDFWTDMTIAAALAVACNTLLVAAVRHDDLSLLGPINSFKPVVSLLPALMLIGERPGLVALAGIALVVLGSCVLVSRSGDLHGTTGFVGLLKRPGVRYRIAALILSGVEAVFLKRALLAATPTVTFLWWSILGFACAAAAAVVLLRRGAIRRQIDVARQHAGLTLAVAAATGAMQYSTLWVFADAPVASALALFQLSSIVNVVIGHRLFGEPDVVRRLIASIVMAGGAVLITLDR